MFRDRKKLEKDYEARGVRNPLSDDMLGKWFDAVHKRREANRTGCDYLILTTLWGTRRMEGLPLVWRDMILIEAERKKMIELGSIKVRLMKYSVILTLITYAQKLFC